MKKVYPIVIKFNSKEIQIGGATVEVSSGNVINRSEKEHEIFLEDINIPYKKGDFLTKLKSNWW